MDIIAFDFDGVIHKYRKGWHDGTIYDDFDVHCLQCIQKLMDKGYAVLIMSTRDPEQIVSCMFPFEVQVVPEDIKFWNENNVVGVTDRKLPAKVYVDDRAYKFEPMGVDQLVDDIDNFENGGW